MYFPLILAALLITSTIYLVHQFWYRALDATDPDDGARHTADDASRDALKAA